MSSHFFSRRRFCLSSQGTNHIALDEDPTKHDAVVRMALLVNDLRGVIEAICSCTFTQIMTCKKIDLVKFGSYRPIKSMICKITLLELLLAYAGIQHYEGFQVYRMMERQYYKAGEKRMETDEDILIRIITRRGMVHLVVVEKETSGFLHLIFYQL